MRRNLGHRAWLLALVSALAACGNPPCARHSDCPTGLTCSADSVCIIAVDAAVDDGGASGGSADAATDAATDAAADAPADAATDAPADAPADGGP